MNSDSKQRKSDKVKHCQAHMPLQEAARCESVVPEEIEIRYAVPSDARAIAELTYHNYGVTYPNRNLYKPELVSTMIESDDMYAYLALWRGKLIGMVGLNELSKHLYEFGLYMVSPAYRQTNAHFMLYSAMLQDFAVNHSDGIIYAGCVTSHVRSQAVGRNHTGTCLTFSAYDAPQYANINQGHQQRETLLFMVGRLVKPYKWHLYAPSEHAALLEDIITYLGGTAELTAYTDEYRTETQSIITSRPELESDPRTKYLLLETCGKDIIPQLKLLTRGFVRKGALAVNIAINLSKPMPADITVSLHRVGYFFAGFMPTTDHSWEMVYEYMTPQAFDFSNIRILLRKSRELLEYVLRDKEIAEETEGQGNYH